MAGDRHISLSTGCIRSMEYHAKNLLAGWRIKLSDSEAWNFGLMELFVLGLLATALWHYCSAGVVEPGSVFAVFRYVLMFVMGLDSVRMLVQQVSRLRDIGGRMREAPAGERELTANLT